jgi:hypothetical protein
MEAVVEYVLISDLEPVALYTVQVILSFTAAVPPCCFAIVLCFEFFGKRNQLIMKIAP